ncbi:hypothetical protein FF125_20330 [Aureibaculum algae]|uniref:Fibronectin type-III domain-containing protein n=1 Tax=Aureibaculum algae TaxID=2584122 RepID=A0A5B7TZ10_9FLAO|nr:hypothetical protein [Aureibaculum algae]QCX40673.1 hypothetical protein FF125_20330 [Aureibaculum algae]
MSISTFKYMLNRAPSPSERAEGEDSIKLRINSFSFLIATFLFCIFSLNAQDSIQQTDIPTVVVKARAKQDKILLRWGVNNKFAWKYGNEYGYIIERTTIIRDGQPLTKPEKITLSGEVIKPKPLAEWENYVDDNYNNNNMAAVAAQAIYGEDFEMNDKDDENTALRVIHQSEELDRRFGFALFSIDQDFEVAQYAGLGYVDTNVKPNEKYLYKVISNVPKELLEIKDAGVFLSPSEEEDLPQPMDFIGHFYKDAFVLVWEYEAFLNYYTSYNLEKSDDGINFKKINKVPITKLADNKSTGISYTDSINQYNKKYWYRIRGISVFNEISKPSKAVELTAHHNLTAVPFFIEYTMISDNEVLLEWTFPVEETNLLKQFDLLWANEALGPYKTVREGISPQTRVYNYTGLKPSNYFKLKAISNHGETSLSSPHFVQPIDSVPPLKPEDLIGRIDTFGVVTLTWKSNTEEDLKGYKIFRADRTNQEFTMLNKYSVVAQSYTDTINLKTFSKNVYYKITALDGHYNQSEYSEIVILQRPDKVPPTSPVFDSYSQENGQVYLKWTKSSSDDVANELIYRTMANTDKWEKIYETETDTTSFFIDDKITPGSNYLYTMIAVDNSGLESPPSPPLSIKMIKELAKPEVKGLYATIDRDNKQIQLFWRYNEADVFEFLIYKKKKDGTYTLFRTATAAEKELVDVELNPNTTYYYGIKAVFKDGSVSKWSEIEVKY